jgi:hypothetical protein
MSKKMIVLILNTEGAMSKTMAGWEAPIFFSYEKEIIEIFDNEEDLSRRLRHYERLGLTDDRIRVLRKIPVNPRGIWSRKD